MVYVNRNGLALRLSDRAQVGIFEWHCYRDVEAMTDVERINLLLAKCDDLKTEIGATLREIAARPAELGPLTRVHMAELAIYEGQPTERKLPEFCGSVISIQDLGDGKRQAIILDQSIVDKKLREAREAKA